MDKKQHCHAAYICLVGENRFQNEILAENLKQIHQCKHSFIVVDSLAEIPKDIRNIAHRKVLIYLDCFGLTEGDLESRLDSAYQIIQNGSVLALFNLSEDSGVEKEALNYGTSGFFHLNDSSDDFCKGTRSILKGEVWLARKIMSEVIRAGIHPPPQRRPHAATDAANLSPREKEVLAHLASGASNAVIAAELFISVHTLRTHLYHIYRKIKVHNRHQASRWAAENL